MPLKRKMLDEDELALLEIIEDPVFFGEFCRSTNNFEVKKHLHPSKPFEYRHYQRDLLTDQTEHIVLVGGRAIGKCQPSGAKIYTTDGYKAISELERKSHFFVYALDNDRNMRIQRAFIVQDKHTRVYTITTEYGKSVKVTSEHPLLTREGWKQTKDITENDYIAAVTHLPALENRQKYTWQEMRWLGYALCGDTASSEMKLKIRYKKQEAELRAIATLFDAVFTLTTDNYIQLIRRKGYNPHAVTLLLKQTGLQLASINGIRRLSDEIMSEPNNSLKIFIESLFSMYADVQQHRIQITFKGPSLSEQMSELLLRFGIESTIQHRTLVIEHERSVYRFWNTFTLPGIALGTLPLPAVTSDENDHMRFERVVSKRQDSYWRATYAVYVYEDHNYISNDLYVHNSLVLEDKIVHEIVNHDIEFPQTPESLLVTANQSQMTPVFNRLVIRFTSSPLLKWYLKNNVNKAQGLFSFPIRNPPMQLITRIAGSRGENNMIGLHVPRIKVDEGQVFSPAAFTQLGPSWNQWEEKKQIWVCGVPNGVRNSILYTLDQKNTRYKKYRIPSHNNPYYIYENDIDAIKQYGGIASDSYQQLVLGRHGSAAYQVLPRDTIKLEPFDFYTYRYSSANKAKGDQYADVLERVKLPDLKLVIAAIDPGFVDPTIINIIGMDKVGIWRTYIRYRLTRIDFPEQEQIINWLDDFYHFSRIGIDIGSGGNGASIMQGLQYRDEYKGKQYTQRLQGYIFNESIIMGIGEHGTELKEDAKSVAAKLLIQKVQNNIIVFSELDAEGVSEIERMAKQRTMTGVDKYFILSETGKGASDNDHIFAAYIVFMLMIREDSFMKPKKKLAKAKSKIL